MKATLILLIGLARALSIFGAQLADHPLLFSGMCDASAAVAISKDVFAVANDEDNLLRFYRVSLPGQPTAIYDLKPLLSSRRKAPEADFEGAARLGPHVFFITSHGRTAQGKPAPLRRQLIALEFSPTGQEFGVKLVGHPYTNLVSDLIADSRFASLGFVEAAQRPPKAPGGLNIEALTDCSNGDLLIGFRNPLHHGKAILIPLQNPEAVVQGRPPKFGDAHLLELGGLGLRGIGSVRSGYYLLAGPVASEGECRMFFWKGGASAPQLIENVRLPGIHPEGICFHDDTGKPEFLILSDDGQRQVNGKECKSLPAGQREFRAFWLLP